MTKFRWLSAVAISLSSPFVSLIISIFFSRVTGGFFLGMCPEKFIVINGWPCKDGACVSAVSNTCQLPWIGDTRIILLGAVLVGCALASGVLSSKIAPTHKRSIASIHGIYWLAWFFGLWLQI